MNILGYVQFLKLRWTTLYLFIIIFFIYIDIIDEQVVVYQQQQQKSINIIHIWKKSRGSYP